MKRLILLVLSLFALVVPSGCSMARRRLDNARARWLSYFDFPVFNE